MINCIYHPYKDFRVVDDETYHQLLDSGEWFATPSLAKEARAKDESKKSGLSDEICAGENVKSETDTARDEIRPVPAEHAGVRSGSGKKARKGA